MDKKPKHVGVLIIKYKILCNQLILNFITYVI